MNASITDNLPRLQWACRRGMLELDVLLGNFLKEGYPALSMEDKQHFVNLLDSEDPALFAWLMGRTLPEDKHLARIIEVIRHHARPDI